jgi:uncharacterized protein (DUF362 family)/Pyruvate/2-oxoacid:ferredoxin oxidoreductase delta subunit
MAGVENTSPQRTRVALVECPGYGPELVLAALRRGVGVLGGMSRFVAANEKILLKPNCLSGANPRKNITTHPAVLQAMGRLCQESGAKVSFGDSPGFGSPAGAAAKSGLTAAAREIGLEEADFTITVQVGFNEAMVAKQLVLAKAAVETDGIISLAKMKTHGFMRITGAVKNQFGCVPGMRKAEFHVKMPRAEHFAAMLVDINRYLRPRLYVLDGIVAMEGNGPGSGTARKMKVLLLSSDPAALDAVFCRLIHLAPGHVPTMKPAALGGLGRYLDNEIEICGDEVSRLECPDFDVVRRPAVTLDGSFPYYLKKWITPRPVIDPALCLNCGVCTEVCPVEPKAVQKRPGAAQAPPVYDYPHCIRCYCCQEMCPHRAITIRRPLLRRLIRR